MRFLDQTNLFTRDDTFFGVCHALGEDFGFHPNWLRLAFALALFWNPLAAVGAYAAVGLVIAATRWLVPEAGPSSAEADPAPANDDSRQAQAWEDLAQAA